MELQDRIEALTTSVKSLAGEMKDKASISADRVSYIETELTKQAAELDELQNEKRLNDIEAKANALSLRVDGFNGLSAADQKAAAILAGASARDDERERTGQAPFGAFLKAMMGARQGDFDAAQELRGIKATLGTSAATGQSIIPNNFVQDIVQIAIATNPYRRVMTTVTGVRGKAVDIPYEVNDSSLGYAQLQGGEAQSFGSNKDNRDFTVASATATLYTLARIIDVGNQFLRQSEGAAERLVVSKLGRAFGLGEGRYIAAGTGSSQPLGYITGMVTAVAANSAWSTALSSEPRVATIGRAMGALQLRQYVPNAIIITPTDYWEAVSEGLGTAYAGGWAIDPAAGPSTQGNVPQRFWGVEVIVDANPAQTVGTAFVGDFNSMNLFFGQDYTIDVSSEAGTRFDYNVTGFRAEEEMGFTATPWTATGYVQRVTGI